MKRVALTVVATITGLVLLLQFKTQPAGAGREATLAPTTASSPSTGSTPTPTVTHSTHRRRHSQPSASPSSSTASGSRSALGQTINTRYGPVQVKVTEVAGRITDVTPVQLPSQDSHSQSIAAYAAPKLRQEAIAADSARIDVVSGATYTSDGYAQSLQSALDNLHG
jgi:uncharacterized protein with FMN-binding domain